MVPPTKMVTKQKSARLPLVSCLAFALLVSGCLPPGPDALRNGKRNLERGDLEQAVKQLRLATTLLQTNPVAWGYLGVACHQSGDVSNAVMAYEKALSLDQRQAEVRYNVGCLYAERKDWANARRQFALFVQERQGDAAGWHRLGEAQLMLGEYTNAGQSLSQSLRLSPSDPDVWNLLGLAYAHRHRTRDAADAFRYALGKQANHGPATWNLAVLTEQQLDDYQGAIELYRRYLALNPISGSRGAVTQAIARLEGTLAETKQPSPPTNRIERLVSQLPLTNSFATTNASTAAPSLKPEVVDTTPPPKPDTIPVALDKPTVAPPEESNTTEVVELSPDPELIIAEVGSAEPINNTVVEDTNRVPSQSAPRAQPPTKEPQKKGFFSRVNPLNLFKGDGNDEVKTTKLPERSPGRVVEEYPEQADEASPPPKLVVAEPDPVTSASYQRYVYRVTSLPEPGDREQALKAFQQAQELRRAGRSLEAMQSYLSAVRADPTCFEAQFNLGLLALQRQEDEMALRAYETAAMLQPQSTVARYNLALALWQAGYPVDAANELAKVLKSDPEEIRAYLTLGNLYAQAFRQPEQARPFYKKVLQLDPQHPQAAAINGWLKANPPTR